MLNRNSCSGIWKQKVLSGLLNEKKKKEKKNFAHAVIPNLCFRANAAGTYLLRVRVGMLVLLLLL